MITFSYCNTNITKGFYSINTDSLPSILLMYCILKQLYSFFFLSSSCMFDHTFSYTSHTSQSYQPIYTGTIVTKCHKLWASTKSKNTGGKSNTSNAMPQTTIKHKSSGYNENNLELLVKNEDKMIRWLST